MDSNFDKEKVSLGVSESGSKYKVNVNYTYNAEKKRMVPDFSEVVDFNELIQSSKDSTDLNVIVQRAKMGDVSVLSMNVPIYEDISDIPTDLNSRMAMYVSVKDDFIKIKQSNIGDVFTDFDDFESAVRDNSYLNRINDFIKAREAEKAKKEDVNNG